MSSAKQITSTHRTFLALFVTSLLSWVTIQISIFSFNQTFATDELTYAHGGWAVSQGQIPYRELFFHHFGGILDLSAIPFLFTDSGVTGLYLLRGLLLVVFAILLATAFVIGCEWGKLAAAVAVFLLCVVEPFRTSMLEVRPDSVGFALFMASAALLGRGNPLIAGILSGGAVWCSEKVLIYGFPLWVGAMAIGLRESRVRYFALGVAIVACAVGLRLLLGGALESFFALTFNWQIVHETQYPPRSSWPFLRVVAENYWGVFIFATIGLLTRARSRRSVREIEIALRVATVTSALSFVLQRAPLQYSAIPFLGLICIFAGKGVGVIWSRVERIVNGKTGLYDRFPDLKLISYRLIPAVFTLCLCASYSPLRRNIWFSPTPNNHSQVAFIQELEKLTAPNAFVYDNTGWAITRNHPHYFYFTDQVVRRVLSQRLIKEIPESIQQKGVEVMVVDNRFSDLPVELKNWLESYFAREVSKAEGSRKLRPGIRMKD